MVMDGGLAAVLPLRNSANPDRFRCVILCKIVVDVSDGEMI